MLETRHLSLGARRALECASVHRGTFSLDALAALGVAEHLDELERGGWLRFDSGGWSFGSELARRLIEDQLQEGLRRRSHMTLAAQFTREGVFLAAEYHRQRGAGNTPRPLELVETRSRSEEPGTKAVAVGTELWLDDSVTCGCSVALDGEKVLWSRGAASGPESTVRFALEKDVVLLRVRGRALLEDGMARDFTGPVASVVLSLPGTATIEVHLCDVPRAEMPDGKTLRLPGNERFDHWMLASAAGALRLSSRAAEAIVEMKVNAYRPLEVAAAGPDAVWVEAYVLERTDLGFEQGEWREPDATEARNPAMVVQS